MPPSDRDQRALALRQQVERGHSEWANTGPGSFVYWNLGGLIDASEILFSDLRIDTPTTPGYRDGRLFFITKTSVMAAKYSDALDYAANDSTMEVGTIDIEIRARRSLSVAWKNRDLRIAKSFTGETQGLTIPLGAITVSDEDWTIDLPGVATHSGDEYLAALLTALGHDLRNTDDG